MNLQPQIKYRVSNAIGQKAIAANKSSKFSGIPARRHSISTSSKENLITSSHLYRDRQKKSPAYRLESNSLNSTLTSKNIQNLSGHGQLKAQQQKQQSYYFDSSSFNSRRHSSMQPTPRGFIKKPLQTATNNFTVYSRNDEYESCHDIKKAKQSTVPINQVQKIQTQGTSVFENLSMVGFQPFYSNYNEANTSFENRKDPYKVLMGKGIQNTQQKEYRNKEIQEYHRQKQQSMQKLQNFRKSLQKKIFIKEAVNKPAKPEDSSNNSTFSQLGPHIKKQRRLNQTSFDSSVHRSNQKQLKKRFEEEMQQNLMDYPLNSFSFRKGCQQDTSQPFHDRKTSSKANRNLRIDISRDYPIDNNSSSKELIFGNPSISKGQNSQSFQREHHRRHQEKLRILDSAQQISEFQNFNQFPHSSSLNSTLQIGYRNRYKKDNGLRLNCSTSLEEDIFNRTINFTNSNNPDFSHHHKRLSQNNSYHVSAATTTKNSANRYNHIYDGDEESCHQQQPHQQYFLRSRNYHNRGNQRRRDYSAVNTSTVNNVDSRHDHQRQSLSKLPLKGKYIQQLSLQNQINQLFGLLFSCVHRKRNNMSQNEPFSPLKTPLPFKNSSSSTSISILQLTRAQISCFLEEFSQLGLQSNLYNTIVNVLKKIGSGFQTNSSKKTTVLLTRSIFSNELLHQIDHRGSKVFADRQNLLRQMAHLIKQLLSTKPISRLSTLTDEAPHSSSPSYLTAENQHSYKNHDALTKHFQIQQNSQTKYKKLSDVKLQLSCENSPNVSKELSRSMKSSKVIQKYEFVNSPKKFSSVQKQKQKQRQNQNQNQNQMQQLNSDYINEKLSNCVDVDVGGVNGDSVNSESEYKKKNKTQLSSMIKQQKETQALPQTQTQPQTQKKDKTDKDINRLDSLSQKVESYLAMYNSKINIMNQNYVSLQN